MLKAFAKEDGPVVRSMTGFGRGETSDPNLAITVEAKAVNHRYLDIAIRLPRELNILEEELRAVFRGQLSRGRIDVYVKLNSGGESAKVVSVNHPLAKSYLQEARTLSVETGISGELTVAELLRLPEVVQLAEAELDMDKAREQLLAAGEQAVNGLAQMRALEGERLALDIASYLDNIERQLVSVEERSPLVVEEYQARLSARLEDMLPEGLLDAGRLAQEVAIFADRACIAEETVRLASHLSQVRSMLLATDAVGRKLDFLLQEMNREINTIGSKANDAEIAKLVVEMKSDLEKIREQVQNIE
jgi:uncharacterized protein (TIGR00255 family)